MNDMDEARWASDLRLVLEAARKAGETALGFFRKDPEVWWKNGGLSPVSAADYAANEILETILRSARPDYGWLSEETDDDADRLSRSTVFVVDPIDGTRAFIGGRDTWCISVAVVHEGRPVVGVLVAPALSEEFTAIEGGVALKNGSPISASGGNTGTFHLAAAAEAITHLPETMRNNVERVPHVPSLAYRLAMVADGRIDGTLVMPNSHEWDLAAADLILECSGGRLAGLDGKPLMYNRRRVNHPALCAAANYALPALLKAFSHPSGS
ncbi:MULTISPECIES: 3'(2'),5'-bisphosphate nucleotidase CysQ [Agrobacterium]|uniref:3'(2'),5'-bisphosphate nucleotidase CysQ n=1 Tax=Agrobacterium pusense TaxID=648995 RepID=A0A6H0ZNP5_9HYPH|nr:MULTISPECIES: 3'(2'),5'-bisphosphate nucleotidase CysQ [Agrobacterium]ANV24666.1 3'(2'),5'-bisphosphate nucleotidase CysQ [Rhizobium sp. S41]KGE82836.1 inositol monophosphatase [Rhizobium sp. H41]HAU74227.1 3'(2'),5'-bisphosphate nucleotidase CysQ [Agrobacterium sp.]MDH0870623.1 3'(2'),5'-bisphosphate nucleotidase CysQ [Agrobacterium pusense]MDH1267988.1 3'(2'),5'-bisphosphate nucleotidase CysQ [Agrobacterium pusense]